MILFYFLSIEQLFISQEHLPKSWASILSQKWLTIFCQEAQTVVYFRKYDFVQISPACDPNTYQIIHGETLDFGSQNH